MRLWTLEGNRPSLTNMQALCVLGLEQVILEKHLRLCPLIVFQVKLQSERQTRLDTDSDRR